MIDEPPDIELKIDKPEYAPWVREDLINANNVAREKNIIKSLTAEQNPFEGMYENQYSTGINPAVSRYDELIKNEITRLKGRRRAGSHVLQGGFRHRITKGSVNMAWGRKALTLGNGIEILFKANANEKYPFGKTPPQRLNSSKTLAIENLRKGDRKN